MRFSDIIDFLDKLRAPKMRMVQTTRTTFSGSVIAYKLCEEDLDAYMWHNKDTRPDCCPICHNALEKVINHDFVVTMKRADIGVTYDGYDIVSEKFVNFCRENNYSNLRIEPLEKCHGLYFFQPTDCFGFDFKKYGTRFYEKRKCCGSYDEIIGSPNIKAPDFKLPGDDFIMTSKYMFASYERKFYEIIVGTVTKKKMQQYGLKGLYFDKVYDSKGLKVTKKTIEVRDYMLESRGGPEVD